MKNQENWYLANRKWARPVGKFILAVPLSYIFVVLLTWAVSFLPPTQVTLDEGQRTLGRIYLYLFLILINSLLGEIIIGRLFKYLDNLWPAVELVTGPEHTNKLASRRRLGGLILQTIVIPFIISAIFFFASGIRLF